MYIRKMDEADRRYWIWLSSFEDIPPRVFYALIARLGSAEAVFKDSSIGKLNILNKAQLTLIEKLNNDEALDRLDERFEKAQCECVTLFDKSYPHLLSKIYDPPPTIFTRGKGSIPNDMCISIVGSRRCTPEGARAAELIAGELAFYGVTVISGMARGIDSMANKGAAEAGGATIAVLGSGVDMIYPHELHELYELIQEKGLIVSEYIPGTRPLGHHFPARNRIISGLSSATVLVEAAKGSGAMITMEYANDQGRKMFAIPGSITSPQSEWPNELIRSQSAEIVTCAEDILNSLNWCSESIRQKQEEMGGRISLEFTEDEARIALELAKGDMTADELVEATGFDIQLCNQVLTLLELRGIIKGLPGGKYSKAGRKLKS